MALKMIIKKYTISVKTILGWILRILGIIASILTIIMFINQTFH